MAAVQASLPLSHFYRETLGSESLSQNLASNELFSPFQLSRVTVNPSRYEKYRATLEKQPRLPWGRLRDYGGMQKVQLPDEFVKPKGYPPEVVQKGHRHYGTGASDPRDLKEEQYYDVTDLHKSHVRTNDQVLPPSPSKEMNDRRIDLPFPSEHPYSSHMPRFALFPNFDSPDDPVKGDPARSGHPIHPDSPATAHKVIVINKAKGAPYRRELQEYPHEGEKDALTWNGENDFYQLNKTVDGGKQPYYPTPPKTIHPNLRLRNEDQRLELRTANSLRNLERDQWKTTYDYNYTGNGPSNTMHLDDYHKKVIDEITSKRERRNDNLIPATTPTLVHSRAMEGRYARLYHNRRPVTADIGFPDSNPKPDTPDVMDLREYNSLPGTPRNLRRKDEWYIAEPGKEVQNTNLDKPGERISLVPMATDADEQWKKMQLSSHPDHGFQKVKDMKALLMSSLQAGEYENLPRSVEESDKLPDVEKKYLKDYQQERDIKFKNIEQYHDTKVLELQYNPREDLHAMRNKTDQMGNRLEPKALDQHSVQVTQDLSRLYDLKTNKKQEVGRFNTGLKFTTENISDRGTITDLHDRQLEGYKDSSSSWMREIPTVDPPNQNHRGVLWDYINKSNPYSLSTDSKNEHGLRSGESRESRRSSTGSILKIPGSPPRTGASKSISFNEVVRVATSEYGSRFKMSSSALAGDHFESPRRIRSSTPLPSPHRSVSEPSVYSGISPTGPALRPTSAFPHQKTVPPSHPHWSWNFDNRLRSEFQSLSWTPRPSQPRNQTALLDLQNGWSKSDAHRRLHESLPEQAPDMRENDRHYELADSSADLRFHHSIKHREKRHQFYGFNSYHFYNGNPIM